MRGGNGPVAPEAWSWVALCGRGAVAARASSGGWRWGMELTAGARLTERRGRGGPLGRRKAKGKTYSCEDATDAQARWADQAVSACGGSEASRRAWPEAGWAARLAGPKLRKKKFLN
jgi:hypothetical protein